MTDRSGEIGRWQAAASIIVLGLMIRVILFAAMGSVDTEAVIRVFPAAEAIARADASGGLDPAVPPLYPVFVALGTWLVGEVEIGARSISILGGVLAGIPLLLLVRRRHGTVAGACALFLTAIHPLLCRYSVIARGEAPAAVFFTWSAYIAWRLIERPSIAPAIALGVVSGIGFLVRPECLAVPAVAIVWVLASRRAGTAKARWIGAASALTPLVLILAVQAAWIHGRTGAWTITPRLGIGLEIAEKLHEGGSPWGLTEDGEDLEIDRKVMRGEYSSLAVAGRALGDPGAALGRTLKSGGRLLTYLPEMIGYANLILLPFALAAFRDRERRRHLLFVVSIIAFTVAVLSLFRPARRMVVCLVPLGVILPAVGLAFLSEWLSERKAMWGTRWAVFVWTTLIIGTVPFLVYAPGGYGGWWSPMRHAGTWVHGTIVGEEEVPGDAHRARVMAYPAELAHFAGMRAIFFPRDGYERTIRYARLHGVDYIAYEEGMAKKGRPEFESSAKEDAHLEPLGYVGGPVHVRLFRMKR